MDLSHQKTLSCDISLMSIYFITQYFQASLGIYIPISSQGHIMTGPKHSYGSRTHTEVTACDEVKVTQEMFVYVLCCQLHFLAIYMRLYV